MRIRFRPLALLSYCTFAIILNAFSGLAGPLSSVLAVLLPSLFICSMAQLLLSLRFFTFHQTFSNDHPQKGEIVRYELHMANEGIMPLARGECRFAARGSQDSPPEPVPVAGYGSRVHTAEIRCAYRGTYTIGLTLYSFPDALGLLRLEEKAEPRVFYVYPELVKLDPGIERFALSSGADQPGSTENDEDPTIFEYLRQLRSGGSARRIAWKRWAASGIPSETVNGQSRSSALRLVLDLWPGRTEGTEKLASEDMAVSAVFSVLRYLSAARIPAELVLGNAGQGAGEHGILIDSGETFTELFDQSTNIIFSDPSFPATAFSPGISTLLVTTRPLVDTESAGENGDTADLFTAFEQAMLRGYAPHLLVCPPPSAADTEKRCLETLAERQIALGGGALLRLADSRLGTEDIAHALCT